MNTSRKTTKKGKVIQLYIKKHNQDVADKISIDKIGCLIVTVFFLMCIAFILVHSKYS